jgi:hypothetical protein
MNNIWQSYFSTIGKNKVAPPFKCVEVDLLFLKALVVSLTSLMRHYTIRLWSKQEQMRFSLVDGNL